MTVRDRSTLKSNKDTAFADNSNGGISEGDLRDQIEDLLDSVYIAGDDNAGNTQLVTADEKTKISEAVISNTAVAANSTQVTNIISLSQFDYDALGANTDPSTVYIIV